MLLHPVQTRLRSLLSAYLRVQQVLQGRPDRPGQQDPLVVTVQMAVRVRQDQRVQLVLLAQQPDLAPQAHLPVLLVLLPVVQILLKYSHSLSLLVLQVLLVPPVQPDQQVHLAQPEVMGAMEVPVPQAQQDPLVRAEVQVLQVLQEPQQGLAHRRQALVL